MTTKRRSKTIKRRTLDTSDHSNLRGGKHRSRKYKFRKKKKTRRRRKHNVGKGVGKSKPIPPSPSPSLPKQTRKSVQFSPSTKSPSIPKTNKTRKIFISKNKHRQKAVVQYENRQQQQNLLDMSLGRIPLDGGNRVRRKKRG